jgi:copper/silver efflux system protein
LNARAFIAGRMPALLRLQEIFMINSLIEWSLKNRIIIIALYIGVAAWGYWALLKTPIDAIPDLSDNQVIVFTDWAGRSPQEVEDQITYPLVTNLQGLPGVRTVRASSAFSFSMVNVIFEDDVDLYWARTRILERLNLVQKQLPEGVTPTLGPDASGVGQVFWYTLESDSMNLRDLRSLQDWFVRYQLNSVPGVAEVASVGGFVQQYQIDVDPNKLRAYNIPLSTVTEAVGRSNSNVGGNVVEQAGEWAVVRGLGLVESVADIENIVIGSQNGTPVYVKNVAQVKLGNAFRTGSLDKNGKEAVGGVVIMRYGASALEVIEAVKRKIEEIKPGLPEGVSIVPFYDRTQLINRTTDTLKTALIEELILVTLVNLIFLAHFRSVLVVTIPLPLAVLVSFLFMKYFGISSNIMSLAGIAIAISDLVDAGIVVTENAYRAIESKGIDTKDKRAVIKTVLEATKTVGRPIFASMAIIILAFVPVFALTGQEGKLFHPLAFTKSFAMIAAAFMAVTLVPVLCTYFLGGKLRPEEWNPIMRFLRSIYKPALVWALRHRLATVALAFLLFLGAVFAAADIGTEFMPPLNEGDLMYMPVTDPAISLEEATRVLSAQDEIIASFPEVAHAVGKAGRAETSTDPSPINMNETVIHLKPESEWRAGMTRERLVAEMDAALRMPGVTNIWTQPIINRIEMLATGIRSQVGIKIFGNDLETLENLSRQIAEAVRDVPGAADVYPEQIGGAPYIDIDINRQAAARYGIDAGTIQDAIEMGVGETNLTITIEGRQRFPIRVRYSEEFRRTPESIGRIPVAAPNGATVPLAQLAAIRQTEGAAMINSENGLLRGSVERARARHRRFCRGSESGDFGKSPDARRILFQLERAIRKSGSCARASDDRHSDCSADYFRHALSDVSLVSRSGARSARRAFRFDGRRLSALDARIQFFGRRRGRFYRAVRRCRADRNRDGRLSRRSRRAKKTGIRQIKPRNSARSRYRRRFAPTSPESDDRNNDYRRTFADYVEYGRGFGSDEAARNARFRRNDFEPFARFDRNAGYFLLAASVGIEKR